MRTRPPGGLSATEATAWLAARLEVANGGRATLGPKRARELAGVSRATLRRAYATGALVVMRPGTGRNALVVISVLRLAEWLVRCERRRASGGAS